MAGVRRLSKKERDERNRVQLLDAATKCKAGDLEQLVKNSPNLNTRYKEKGTPLMQCTTKGSAACVKLLITAGADVNLQDNQYRTTKVLTLSFTIYDRDVNCTKLLLEYGSSIRIECYHGIFLSVTRCKEVTMDMDCLKLFYAAGADEHEAMRKLDAHVVDEDPLRLRHLTRTFIRKRRLKLNPDSNLFKVIEKLPLPSFLKSYLVYNMSLNIIHI